MQKVSTFSKWVLTGDLQEIFTLLKCSVYCSSPFPSMLDLCLDAWCIQISMQYPFSVSGKQFLLLLIHLHVSCASLH